MPVLDAPSAGVVLDDPPAVLRGVGGERGEQQPADRRGAPGRALLLGEHGLQAHWRLVAVFARGGREFDGVGAQRQGGGAAAAAGSFRAPAALGALAQAVDADHGAGTRRRGAQRVEQRPSAGDPAAAVGAHQHVQLRLRALRLEHAEVVGLAIHHAHDPAGAQLASQFGAVPQRLDPAVALARRRRRVPIRLGHGRVEARVDHPQRQPGRRHRQRRVQMQAARLRAGLVAADHPQSVAARTAGEVEVRAVLHAQHPRLRAHAPQRPLAVRPQDVLRRRRAVVRAIHEPVVALDHCPIPLRRGRQRSRRSRPLERRHPHQPGAQPGIAQRRPAELVRRPDAGFQAVPGRQRRRRRGRLRAHAQPPTPVGRQRANIHPLASRRRRVAPILPAPARGLAQQPPVGRPQAGSPVRAVDERLHQARRVAVARLEVRRQPPQQPPKHVRGQVPALHARTDQEPRQPHHPVQVCPTTRRVPADPAIPHRKLQRRRREPRRAQPAVLGSHQVAQLAAHQRPRAAPMLARHQAVPNVPLRRPLHQHDAQTPNPTHGVRHPDRRRHRRRRPAAHAAPARRPRRRQANRPDPLQRPKRRQTAARLHHAARVAETELLAHRSRQTRAVQVRTRAPQRLNPRLRLHSAQTALDQMLCIHAAQHKSTARESPVPLVGHG